MRYFIWKYLVSIGKLCEIEEWCIFIYGYDYDVWEKVIYVEVEVLMDEWIDRVKNWYKVFKVGLGFVIVEDFII